MPCQYRVSAGFCGDYVYMRCGCRRDFPSRVRQPHCASWTKAVPASLASLLPRVPACNDDRFGDREFSRAARALATRRFKACGDTLLQLVELLSVKS